MHIQKIPTQNTPAIKVGIEIAYLRNKRLYLQDKWRVGWFSGKVFK